MAVKTEVPGLRRLRKEDCDLEASLGYISTLSQGKKERDEERLRGKGEKQGPEKGETTQASTLV